MSDRPGAKKTTGYGQSRSRQKWAHDDDAKSDTFSQPFMLTKTVQRVDAGSAYLRNVEKQRDVQLSKQKEKESPYQQSQLKPTQRNHQPFEQITHSAKSEGRAQKNLAHFRQLNKNARRSELEAQAKIGADDNADARKAAGQSNQEVDTTQSTAAQSSEVPKNNLLRRMSQEKNR